MPNAQIMREVEKILDFGRYAYTDSLDYQAAIIAVSEWHEARAPKPPQDMNLRELIEHAAEVNDALREALRTHPGLA